MQKLGINIDSFEDFKETTFNTDFKDRVKIIADLGFEAIFSDLTFQKNPTEIAEQCARLGLEYQFLHSYFKNANNIWLKNLKGDETLEILCSNVDSCNEANVPILVVHVSSGFTPPPLSKVGKERWERLVEYAANKNVKIAFENLRVPRFLKWAMNHFKDADNVGFCWDTGHENCFTNDIEYMSLYGDRLLCTHIHDNNKELGRDLHLIPFDGKIDFNKVAFHLKNSNFSGPLMLEIFSKNEIYDNIGTLDFYTKAYNAIEKIRQITLE